MEQFTIPNTIEKTALDAYIAATLDGAKVGLFINDILPDVNTVVGDFVEPGAEWGGYAQVTVTTWGVSFIGANGPEAKSMIHFPGPTSGAGDNVYGWFLTDGAGVLQASGRFGAAPVDGTLIGGAINFVLASRGMAGGDVQVITV